MPIRERAEEQTLVIEERFQGLPEVAHGGYVAGAIAGGLGADAVEVRLRRPVPTGRRLGLTRTGEGEGELHDGETLLAEAAPTALSIDVPPAVTPAEAEAASRRFPGLDGHPIPGCVVCGTGRTAGDGLRIFTGPVAGRRLVAAPWVPAAELGDDEGRVPDALGSAALDCAQLWALIVHAPPGTRDLVVTASFELQLVRPVTAGEPHVVVGWPIGREERAWFGGAAVFGPDGEICMFGRQRAAITSWGVPLRGPRPAEDRKADTNLGGSNGSA